MPSFFYELPVRALTSSDLGVLLPVPAGAPAPDLVDITPAEEAYEGPRIGSLIQSPGATGDTDLELAANLLDDGFAGIIYAGIPGTGKSRIARRVGLWLAQGDPARFEVIQFHPSYQYEDFIEGFVPLEEGEGFSLQEKHFVELCRRASDNQPKIHVLVIEELSRADPSRVFGEALSFIEQDKKGKRFKLASGKEFLVPDNLILLATMNDRDRGVDEVDVAFERRFARVEVLPSVDALDSMLQENGISTELRQRLRSFFLYLINHSNPEVHLGHGYFARVRSFASLERLWNYQLLHLIQRAFRLAPNETELNEIKQRWQRVIALPLPGETAAANNLDPTNPAFEQGTV